MKSNEARLIKRVAILALGTALLQAAWGGEPNQQKEGYILRFAFSSSIMEADVNPDDAIAAARVWTSTFGKDIGAWTESDARIFNDIKSIAASVNNDESDIIALGTNEYLELEGFMRAEPVLTYMLAGQVGIDYIVIARRDGGIKTLADLRGKRLAVTKGGQSTMASLWLDALLLDNHLPAKESLLREIKEVAKSSQVVLPVFFKQIDAGIVIKSAFDTAAVLNPQIGQQVKIITTSPRLIPMVTCFRSSLSSETKTLYLKNALNLHNNPGGLQTFNVFKIDQLLPWESHYFDTIRDLMKKQKLLISTLRGQNRTNARALEGIGE